MKALVEISMLKKNKKKRGTSLYTHFFSINFSLTYVRKGAEEGQKWQGNLLELKGTHLNSFQPVELKGTLRNSRELMGTLGNSRELEKLKGTQGT